MLNFIMMEAALSINGSSRPLKCFYDRRTFRFLSIIVVSEINMPILDNSSFLRALKKMFEDSRTTGSVHVTFKSGFSSWFVFVISKACLMTIGSFLFLWFSCSSPSSVFIFIALSKSQLFSYSSPLHTLFHISSFLILFEVVDDADVGKRKKKSGTNGPQGAVLSLSRDC